MATVAAVKAVAGSAVVEKAVRVAVMLAEARVAAKAVYITVVLDYSTGCRWVAAAVGTVLT